MDVLEGYFKRLCFMGAAEEMAALQDQIHALTRQLAEQQQTLYYSEAANLRLTTQLADQNRVISHLVERVLYYIVRSAVEKTLTPNPTPQVANQLSTLAQQVATLRAGNTQLGGLLVYLLQRPIGGLPQPQDITGTPASRSSTPKLQHNTIAVPATPGADADQRVPLQRALQLTGTLITVWPISDDYLSVRTAHCLKRSGINTVNALVLLSRDDLLDVRNFGPYSLAEVEAMLRAQWPHFTAGDLQS